MSRIFIFLFVLDNPFTGYTYITYDYLTLNFYQFYYLQYDIYNMVLFFFR